MPETHVNAYKAELVQAEIIADQANSRVKALKDYIKVAEKNETTKADESDQVEAEEIIKATDTKNETRPVVEDSLAELPEDKPAKKGKK